VTTLSGTYMPVPIILKLISTAPVRLVSAYAAAPPFFRCHTVCVADTARGY
jgi:hypothetical protein